MGETFISIVLNGQLILAAPIALAAGIVSFASPCVLPLVPGYLGYISGMTRQNSARPRTRLVLGVGLFILGSPSSSSPMVHCSGPLVLG